MIKNKFTILITILLSTLLNACQTAKDAFEGKKRSEQSDEFLVEKKNPLVQPPEFSQLPVPGEKLSSDELSTDNIENILSKGSKEVSQTESTSKKIEENILDKINNR